MPDPVASHPITIRADVLDPEWMVDLAAVRARVDTEAKPVRAFGPSFQELQQAQKYDVAHPVQTLVRRISELSATERLVALWNGVRSVRSAEGCALSVEGLLVAIWGNAVEEGNDLRLARIRDAKMLVFLQLAKRSLSVEFVARASKTRVDGLGEATRILNQLDRVPGLRQALVNEIEYGIANGRAALAALGVTDAVSFRRLLERGVALIARSEQQWADETNPSPLSATDAKILDFMRHFRNETPFRLGAYAAVFEA